jgi:hypothetical protein
MESVLANQKTSSLEKPRRMFTTDSEMQLAARHLRRSRQIQAVAILGGVPLALAVWVILSRVLDLDVIFTARAAMLSALPFVVIGIFSPLLLRYPKEVRWRGYIVQWFCLALFFNIVWQIPPVALRSIFEGVEHTQANLPYYIFWWGYHSSDLDYGEMTRFWVLAEVSFWVISVLVVAGLVQLWRGREAQAFALLGVCGALQIYNVAFFIGYGGIVLDFDNIATDSVLAPVLYWTFNMLWGVAGCVASVLSFAYLFLMYKRRSGA